MTEKKNELIVAAVLGHRTLEGAARRLGLTYNGLWRAMQRPEVKEALVEARRAALDACLRALQAGLGEAVATLRKILADPKVSPGVRVRACGAVLDAGLRAITLDEIEKRLAALESARRK